ncbi:MAG: hypothetical protein PHE38_11065 [Alishewanella agri]|nr:hypothetical protein [Alishewanella agri]
MGAQVIAEIYRSQELGSTFSVAFTITYFGDTASIQGVSGSISPACIRELIAYLQTKPGITHLSFIRKKPAGERLVKYPLKGLCNRTGKAVVFDLLP